MHFIIALLLVSPSPDPIVVTAAATTNVKPAKPKKICRAGAVTGTRMTTKMCKTQDEWDAQASTQFNKTDAFSNNGLSGY